MQSSFRDRGRDLGFHHHHHQRTSAESLSESEPMVLGMSAETYQANGHDNERNYEHSARESSSGVTKKTPPANGKKTKGRVKIKMEFIDNKLRRYTTFSKRKTGIMKKAYELSTLTGTQVMLLVASETGHVYTFATRKLQPMITSEAGKALIQTCLNSPDPPPGPGASGLDQRMSATGFEETDLTYSVADDCDKMSDDIKPVFTADMSPASISPGTILTPSLVSITQSVPTSTISQRNMGTKSTTNLSSVTNSPLANSGFTTILSSTDSEMSPTLRIGTFQSPDSPDSPAGQRESPQTVYGIPTTQTFSLAIAGGTKNQVIPVTSSNSGASSHNSISVVQGSTQNLSVVSGNVVIPAAQTILQGNGNSAVVYQTAQGLVYATPANLPEGVVLNLGQEQPGGQQQFITIPLSLSLSPAQQQQLMQRQVPSQNSSFNVSSSSRRDKSRK